MSTTDRPAEAADGTVLPDDLDPVEASLLQHLAELTPRTVHGSDRPAIDRMSAATLLEAQITSRLIDHTARWLRREHNLGHYTIGSAGHEANAAVALALRPTDPALLHYRSGGFYVARSLQAAQTGTPAGDPVDDILRGMLARATEPIAGGRHKVFGNRALSIIPQTSTIASHLPRAVGLARSFELGQAAGAAMSWPADSVVVCSFGDGSLNHSTAQGAVNWAAQLTHAGHRVPVVFVCEDNGIGLSVPTTPSWVADSIAGRSTLDYVPVDGTGPAAMLATLPAVVAEVRRTGRPAFVHLETVRYLGHAGTDVETAYRSAAAIRHDLDRDPIRFTAELNVSCGTCGPADLVDWYLDLRTTIRSRAIELADEPALADAAAVVAPIASMTEVKPAPGQRPDSDSAGLSGRTMAQTINHTLAELLERRPELLAFGEDVGRKGGVYGVTRGLQKRFGPDRVFDTILDEQSVLGLALGSSLNGMLPIPEIQYLAYLHNAEDQLRGEAATLAFFSNGQYHNPMVVRVASYAYQRGFGGHFHNDNSVAVLRDVPGLVIASPGHPDDAGPMLRACVDHAASTGAVCVYLEPIALYHTTDLHLPDDQLWTTDDNREVLDPTGARVHGDGTDLTIVSWANGLHRSLRAAKMLADGHGVSVRVVDLRWLSPLPIDQLLEEADRTGRLLVVDETRRTGGVGEGVVAELVAAGFGGRIDRIAGDDSFIPLGAAANHVLVDESDIVAAALAAIDPAAG
ncbi:MAG: thiamine pyrophosphate-dependent enzyme [Actinomycetota bacterium]